MTNQAELLEVLSASFEDRRLDVSEKHVLLTLLKNVDKELKAYTRNRAFDLVEEASKTEPVKPLLKWLEKVIKVTNADDAPSFEANAFFSPGDDCKDALLDYIWRARHSIDICVFTVSDNDISDALISKYEKGTKIRIITDDDKSSDRGSDVALLKRKGIALKMDKTRHHMHHKFAVFDKEVLVTGSFNWTRSASDYNHENILAINESSLVVKYLHCFDELWRRF